MSKYYENTNEIIPVLKQEIEATLETKFNALFKELENKLHEEINQRIKINNELTKEKEQVKSIQYKLGIWLDKPGSSIQELKEEIDKKITSKENKRKRKRYVDNTLFAS